MTPRSTWRNRGLGTPTNRPLHRPDTPCPPVPGTTSPSPPPHECPVGEREGTQRCHGRSDAGRGSTGTGGPCTFHSTDRRTPGCSFLIHPTSAYKWGRGREPKGVEGFTGVDDERGKVETEATIRTATGTYRNHRRRIASEVSATHSVRTGPSSQGGSPHSRLTHPTPVILTRPPPRTPASSDLVHSHTL